MGDFGEAEYGHENMPDDLKEAVERGQRIAESRFILHANTQQAVYEKCVSSPDSLLGLIELAKDEIETGRELRKTCEDLRNEIAALKEQIRGLETRPSSSEDVEACLRVIRLLGRGGRNEREDAPGTS